MSKDNLTNKLDKLLQKHPDAASKLASAQKQVPETKSKPETPETETEETIKKPQTKNKKTEWKIENTDKEEKDEVSKTAKKAERREAAEKKVRKTLSEKIEKGEPNKKTVTVEEKDVELEALIKKINENSDRIIKEASEKIDKTFGHKKENESIEKDPLILLDETRTKYAEDYKKSLAENSNWFTRNITRKIFGSKIKESETPKYLKDSEEAYEKATIAYGKKMYSEKEAELKLQSSTMSINEQREELKRYKQTEIFNKVIIEEQSLINGLKVENLPIKEKGVVKKSLEWYLKQPRWKKIAISTALSTGIIAVASSGSIVVAGGVAAYAGTKYVKGLAGSTIGQVASKTYDWLFKSKSADNRISQEKELSKEFAEESFDTSLTKDKKEYAEILEREKKANRRRLVTKAMITIAAGGLASYEMGSVLHEVSVEHVLSEENLIEKPTVSEHITGEVKTGIKIGKVEGISPKPIITEHPTHETKTTGSIKTPVVKTDTIPKTHETTTEIVKEPEVKIKTGFTPKEPEIKTEFKTEKVEFSSKGAIQTIHDLKAQISHDYSDISKAPASVQEFMKTGSTEEAIKLGLYDPNSGAESAMLLKGSTIGFDEHGTLSIHDIKTNQDSILVHGETTITEHAPEIEKYHGQMMDSDHQVEHHGQHLTPEDDASIDKDLVKNQVNPEDGSAIDKNLEQRQVNPIEDSTINNQAGTAMEKPYFLTPERMIEVRQTNAINIKHMFGSNTALWDNIKDSHMERLSADKMMHLNFEGVSEDTKKIVSYLNKLREVTGVNPTEETLITPAETINQYVERALGDAVSDPEIGLDKVTF